MGFLRVCTLFTKSRFLVQSRESLIILDLLKKLNLLVQRIWTIISQNQTMMEFCQLSSKTSGRTKSKVRGEKQNIGFSPRSLFSKHQRPFRSSRSAELAKQLFSPQCLFFSKLQACSNEYCLYSYRGLTAALFIMKEGGQMPSCV